MYNVVRLAEAIGPFAPELAHELRTGFKYRLEEFEGILSRIAEAMHAK